MRYFVFFLAVALIAPAFTGCGYNTIQKNDESVIAAWGDVEASYQRRADLIPNLVETVKAYAAHEKDTLTAVTEARAKVGQLKLGSDTLSNPEAIANFQAAQGSMTSALSKLMVVVEKYPDLNPSS